MANGPHLVRTQTAQQVRAAHRRALRRKLGDLIDAANEAYQRQRWDDFESCKSAIRLVLADLAGSKAVPKNAMDRVPATPRGR